MLASSHRFVPGLCRTAAQSRVRETRTRLRSDVGLPGAPTISRTQGELCPDAELVATIRHAARYWAPAIRPSQRHGLEGHAPRRGGTQSMLPARSPSSRAPPRLGPASPSQDIPARPRTELGPSQDTNQRVPGPSWIRHWWAPRGAARSCPAGTFSHTVRGWHIFKHWLAICISSGF